MDRSSDNIACPECGTEIEITAALSTQLGEKLRKEFEAKQRDREREFADREAALNAQQEAVGKEKESLDQEIAARLASEREKLRAEEAAKAKEQVTVELQDKDTELASAREQLKLAQQSELDLRKKARELEEAKEQLDLTLARKLDEERAKIRESAKKEVDEERQFKDAEKDKLIGDLKQQIGELKRKSEQGSQQLQGEVLELGLEDLLSRHFPYDNIVPVPKGVHGGDVLQEVHDQAGYACGAILWESKRTKNWSDAWLAKLRDDQRAAKAQIAVLVSIEMPKEIQTFSSVDGVWVTSWACALGIAQALREGLLEVAHAKQAMDGQQGKMELLYNYLSGPEFRHRVDGIAEAFVTMKSDLESEKRSMQRIWAKREKQLERAIVSTSGMYGDLQGIVGRSLPEIEQLALPAIEGPENGEADSNQSESEDTQ